MVNSHRTVIPRGRCRLVSNRIGRVLRRGDLLFVQLTELDGCGTLISAQRCEAIVDDPFAAGSVVVVTLNMPREKFWGTLLALTPAGASLRGIDLNSLDDFARQVRDGDQVNANLVFFPMHRIERIESDARNGDIPSLQERFETKSGRAFQSLASVD